MIGHRTEIIGNCALILADCTDAIRELPKYDEIALISDPPYGIRYSHGIGSSQGIGSGKYRTKFANVSIVGDDQPFDPAPWSQRAVQVILWGANHFSDKLPSVPGWLIWDKRAASHHSNDFADCELAWSNFAPVARVFRHHWDGMMKASERGVARVHPTQKPIALMEWCISMVRQDLVIVDPFMGSGTTGIACARLGRRFIGVEIDEGYFDIACRRIRQAYSQSDMFADQPSYPAQWEQSPMFGDGE